MSMEIYWNDYNDTKGVIEIIVHEDALPYFVVLVDYTRLNYSYIGSLKNTYSVRTYLICKVIQNKYTPSININFDIEEFKTKIGLKGKYKNVPLFRERVLDVIKNEINTKTDIVFDYSLEKIGRSFKNIEIKIYQKGKNTLITSGLEYIVIPIYLHTHKLTCPEKRILHKSLSFS